MLTFTLIIFAYGLMVCAFFLAAGWGLGVAAEKASTWEAVAAAVLLVIQAHLWFVIGRQLGM